jgi:hydroxymethylbilane synthase
VVHSLKDLPTKTLAGTAVTVPVRAPVEDVLVARADAIDRSRPFPLRPGSRIGTGAARRMSLVRRAAPDCEAVPIRGNVPTRARKAASGELDAVILARAGLVRLGFDLGALVPFDLDPALWIPAPGQGALALQTRDSGPAREAVAALGDPHAAADIAAERGVLGAFEGGCHAAVGAWADRSRGELVAGADLGDGWRTVRVPLDQPDATAVAVARLRGAAPDAGPATWAHPAAPWELVRE